MAELRTGRYLRQSPGQLALAAALLITSHLLGAHMAEADEAEPQAQPQDGTSVALSSAVLNPTTLLWQIQLEQFSIFESRKPNDFDEFKMFDGGGTNDYAQNFRLRLIIPLERGLILPVPQLIRVIGFLNTAPGGATGLGDVTLNQFFILAKKNWGEFGAGWDLQAPARTNDKLGSPQWQIGPTATISFSELGNWQMYWVWQNFFSVNKNGRYGSQEYAVVQPNIFYTWSNGVYMGGEPLWKIDYDSGDVAIPLNFRVGYIFQAGGFKYNAYVEPEWMAYRSSDTTLDNNNWGIRFGFRIFLPEN